MNRIKKILACVDFSEYSLIVLKYAVELANNEETEIIVYNVINQKNINGVETVSQYFPSAFDIEDYLKELRKDTHKTIKHIIKENFFDQKSMMSIKVDMGIPFECILKTAKTENVDLIIMANKGRGNLSKVLFGSAAEKVFRHSPVPVVSVRDKTKFKRRCKDAEK
ncbi:MAG: universal stress protein [Desulfobacteraceae bacterium]|nr:universal stress protein [Desulfobacteraceae bacterium]